jgi:hypothetical protein
MGTGLIDLSVIIYHAMQESDSSKDKSRTDILTAATDPVLAALWDNDEDAIYDDWPFELEIDDAR